MRSSPLFAALVALALLANVPQAAAKADAPTLAPGDSFDTKTTTSTSGVASTTTARTVVLGLEQIDVGGTTYDAVKMQTTSESNTTSSGVATTSTTVTTSWLRANDGATLKTSSTTTSSYTLPGVGPQTTTSGSDTTYDKPCASVQWPLDVGRTWSTTCYYNTTTTGAAPSTTAGSVHSTTKVARTETAVVVPAGTFDTLVLVVTFTDPATGSNATTTQWYAPKACTNAKTTSGTGANTVTVELAAYKCAATASATTTTSTSTTTSTTTTTSTPPTGSTTTTSTVDTSTTTTTVTSTTPKVTGVPGPAIVLVLAAVAGVAVLATRRRSK